MVEVGSPDAPPGSREWALWQRATIIDLLYDSNSSAERLRSHLDAVKAHDGWRHLEDEQGRPFGTYREFCCARQPFGLAYDPDDIDRLCRERLSAQAKAQSAIAIGSHGGLRIKGTDQVSGRNLVKGGEKDDYHIAILARDHKDILARLQAGEFESVAAAAREAGIKRHYPKVTPTPEGFARAARKHIPEQIAELVRLLSQEVG